MTRIDNGEVYEKLKLDVKDKKILDILSEDSRMPITQLAKRVDISRDVANYKINRLVSLGIIERFIPRIDFRKLGFNTYHIFMMIDESKEEKGLLEKLKSIPEVHFVFEYSDKWDLEVVLIARNIRELDKIVSKLQAEFSVTIMERIELLEINTYQSIIFSYFFNKDIKKLNLLNEEENGEGVKFDKLDLQILNELCKDARASTYEIAKTVKLSADAIGLRIKRLLKEKIIKKFTILPNFSKLQYNWHTFCVKMKVFDEETEKKFKSFIELHPGIIRAAKTFGDWDVLMYIVTENSKEFHKIVKDIKMTFPDIVKNYITFVAYKEHCYFAMPNVLVK